MTFEISFHYCRHFYFVLWDCYIKTRFASSRHVSSPRYQTMSSTQYAWTYILPFFNIVDLKHASKIAVHCASLKGGYF